MIKCKVYRSTNVFVFGKGEFLYEFECSGKGITNEVKKEMNSYLKANYNHYNKNKHNLSYEFNIEVYNNSVLVGCYVFNLESNFSSSIVFTDMTTQTDMYNIEVNIAHSQLGG